jgi:hypothetical protein
VGLQLGKLEYFLTQKVIISGVSLCYVVFFNGVPIVDEEWEIVWLRFYQFLMMGCFY